MILSDRDLHALVPQMAFETDESRRPFRPDEQIQPCSIDLRLDRCFWVPRKPTWRRSIDLRNPLHGEMDVRRLFPNRWLRSGEGITIKPGQMILGRTFEKFTMPNGYAGKLEGRTTFSRLGLSIYCSGGFINPGWRGRMPLQLVNHTVVPIVLAPYLSVCQLLVTRTSTESEKPYGSPGLDSKYMNDEGEPSRYYQDARIHRLQEAIARVNLPERVRREFMEVVGGRDGEVVDRFLAFLHSLPSGDMTSARDVLEQFAERDTRGWKRARGWLLFRRWLLLLPVSTSLGALLKTPYDWPHYLIWAITAALLPFGLWAMLVSDEPSPPFRRRDVEQHFEGKT